MLNANGNIQSWNLVGNVGASITDVAVHLAHHANMLVTVKKRVFVLAMHAGAASASVYSFVRLETGIG